MKKLIDQFKTAALLVTIVPLGYIFGMIASLGEDPRFRKDG